MQLAYASSKAQYRKAKDIVAGPRKLHTGAANEPYFDEMDALYPYEESAPINGDIGHVRRRWRLDRLRDHGT